MGVVENITHDKFPRQNSDLKSIVSIVLNGSSVAAEVVRSDAESPSKKILKTQDGLYIDSSETESFSLPEQGSWLNRDAEVCFHYNTDRIVNGKIVRDDNKEPFRTVIKLDDGRVVYATECQYSPRI